MSVLATTVGPRGAMEPLAVLPAMESSVPLANAHCRVEPETEGLHKFRQVIGKHIDQDGGAGAASGDRYMAMRNADKVAAGHGRAIHRRVGQ